MAGAAGEKRRGMSVQNAPEKMRPGPQDRPRADFRPLALGPRSVISERRADGCIVMRSGETLAGHPTSLTSRIIDGAREHPERTMLAQRHTPGGPWHRMSYAEVAQAMRAVAQALLDRGATPDRPVAILSGARLEHAIVAYAAMHVGIPYAPISPAYSLLSADFRKLGHMLDLLTPGLILCDDHALFARAIEAAAPSVCEIVAVPPLPPARLTDKWQCAGYWTGHSPTAWSGNLTPSAMRRRVSSAALKSSKPCMHLPTSARPASRMYRATARPDPGTCG